MDRGILSRVNILAVGVERYQHMRPLAGPAADLHSIEQLLVSTSQTALFSEGQFVALKNPTSDQLREKVSSYVLSRSARGDILIFYFSGHGVPIGSSDFGFCTIDTMIHPGSNTVLPFTVVAFSDLLESLAVMGVIPVIIIDACYSGIVGNLVVSPSDAIQNMHEGIRKSWASNYALLCSCSETQVTFDNPRGGFFSQCLFQLVSNGVPNINRGVDLVGLKDIYQPVVQVIERETDDVTPRLYIGDIFPNLPIAKNVQFAPQSYSFVGHLKRVIDELWNNGAERELTPGQILESCGNGAYGNHQKLSLSPWLLVENAPGSKNRRLTKRGRLFAQGRLKIPKTIQLDPDAGNWIASEGSPMVDVNLEVL